MKIEVYNDSVKENMEVDEGNFYKDVSEYLSKQTPTNNEKEIKVVLPDNTYVKYIIKKRSGTLFIVETENTIDIKFDKLPSCFLTCVNPEKNSYKFYKLEEILDHNGNPTIKASYGRMGVAKGELFGERSYYYPLSMYWIKKAEKLAKGYVDRTNLYLDNSDFNDNEDTNNDEKENKKVKKANPFSVRLFNVLSEFAKCAVKKAKVKAPITPAIIDESKRLLNKMRESNNLNDFNFILEELIAILQRPVSTGNGMGVKEMLADSMLDKKRIIEREEDLIAAMEGSVYGNKCKKENSFSDYGISCFEATAKQKELVLSKLSDTLKPKVKNVYRVIPHLQKKAFEENVETNNVHKFKYLWHGSRNQNWLSIVINSLKLNPNAIITGKMFGDGIYFAPSSLKSWNYTSYSGTYWANGNSDVAFMGLYKCAYGNAWNVNDHSSYIDYKNETIKRGCNCLHAHAGRALRNDEIIFYDESSMLLEYIVEFN